MKTRQIVFNGFCPIHNENCSISINYIDASTYEGPEYSKGTIASCPYIKNEKPCNIQCPIWSKALQTVRYDLN